MPNEQKVTRKLRAILSADVKGYSVLMSDDEVFTIRTLKEYRNIMSNCIQQHSGRVVDNPGDNLLAEFSSALDAVECAVEVQKKLKKENARFVEDKRLQFRIGVNIGDVVQDGDRIYGSGVNVAARIEGLADPGGICVSRNTYDHVKDKLDLGFDYLGEHEVKNTKEPVRVYKVLMGTDVPKSLVEEKLDLPDKPSIAVLPFTNMSGDPSQEYFSDGLTEQIINGLCKVKDLFVIARNSSFSYKNKPVNIKQVAQELGVKYILEGSVQRAGERVRITAQLINAKTDYHMWSENYDRDLDNIFKLQDEITMKVITAMQVKLTQGEKARHWTPATKNLKAYMHVLKGLDYLHRENVESILNARNEGELAVRIDPNYVTAYNLIASTYMVPLWWETGSSRITAMKKCKEYLDRAIELDNKNSDTYIIKAMLYFFKRQFDEAIKFGRKAITLNQNNAMAYMFLGCILHNAEQNKEALRFINKSFELDPIPSNIAFVMRGEVYFSTKKYTKAVSDFENAIASEPNDIFAHMGLVATYHWLGITNKVATHKKAIYRIDPNFSLEAFADSPATDPDSFYTANYWVALREAGLK